MDVRAPALGLLLALFASGLANGGEDCPPADQVTEPADADAATAVQRLAHALRCERARLENLRTDRAALQREMAELRADLERLEARAAELRERADGE